MFCQYCGMKLPDNARFCSKCGKPVTMPDLSSDEQTPSRFRKPESLEPVSYDAEGREDRSPEEEPAAGIGEDEADETVIFGEPAYRKESHVTPSKPEEAAEPTEGREEVPKVAVPMGREEAARNWEARNAYRDLSERTEIYIRDADGGQENWGGSAGFSAGGSAAGQRRNGYEGRESDPRRTGTGGSELRYSGHIIEEDGRRVPGTERPKPKKHTGVKVVLLAAIVVLSAAIAWEVFTIVRLRTSHIELTAPELHTSSTVVSGTESGTSADETAADSGTGSDDQTADSADSGS